MKKILWLFSLLFAMFCFVSMEWVYASSTPAITPTAKVISVTRIPTQSLKIGGSFDEGYHFRMVVQTENATHISFGLKDRTGNGNVMKASENTAFFVSAQGVDSISSLLADDRVLMQKGEYTEALSLEDRKNLFVVDIFSKIPADAQGGEYSSEYQIKLAYDPNHRNCDDSVVKLSCSLGAETCPKVCISPVLTLQGKDTVYHYEPDQTFDLMKFQLKAAEPQLILKGFTLTNMGTLDIEPFLENIEIFANGRALQWVRYGFNPQKQLMIVFDPIDIVSWEKVAFVVKMTLKDFNGFGKTIAYTIKNTSDLNLVNRETGERVFVTLPSENVVTYKFEIPIAMNLNTLTRPVEYVAGKTDRRVVFDGAYVVVPWVVRLTDFELVWSSNLLNSDFIHFYLTVDDRVVGRMEKGAEHLNYPIDVNPGQVVKIRIEAEVGMENTGKFDYGLVLKWEDINGDIIKVAESSLSKIVVLEPVLPTVAHWGRNNVVLRDTNISLAKFSVKPSNGATEADIDSLEFDLNNLGGLTADDVRIRVDGVEIGDIALVWNTFKTENVNERVGVSGVEIEFIAKKELPVGNYTITLAKVNATTTSSSVSKKVVDALVRVVKMENLSGDTRFTLAVERYDDSVAVSDFKMSYANNSANRTSDSLSVVDDGAVFNVAGESDTHLMINKIEYNVNGATVAIDKAQLEDYFMVWGASLKVFKA